MAASPPEWVRALEYRGELIIEEEHFTEQTGQEVLAMSGATIDRYLKDERDRLELRGLSATKRGALLRNSIQIQSATQEVETEPGFFEIDTDTLWLTAEQPSKAASPSTPHNPHHALNLT